MLSKGVIVCSFGLNYLVETDHKTYQTISKAKQNQFVVGDVVNIEIINKDQAQIISLFERKNLISRADFNKTKIIASNIDNLIIVIAVKPNCNLGLLNNLLLFAESMNINPIIVINKIDLAENNQFELYIKNLYSEKLNYHCVCIQATDNCFPLIENLLNKNSLLVGQSGVGKSSIINKLIPTASAKIGAIKKSATSGCHITTNAILYHYNSNSNIIDCPGVQDFGLMHLSHENLIEYFPELRNYKNKCKYRNCSHLNENSCMILNAFNNKEIDSLRYELFKDLNIKFEKQKKYNKIY